MAEIRVNPTRMELKRLQARYQTARRGHKLLKDKRDELMRRFLAIVKDCKELRIRVEQALAEAYAGFDLAGAATHPKILEESLLLPRKQSEVVVSMREQMGITTPAFSSETGGAEQDTYNYGFAFTSGELDGALTALSAVRRDLLLLAAAEKEVQLLSAEIERTRRRVNALEHIMMPRYLEAIRVIKMKLEENERGNITRLMKVKDMMLAAKQQNAHAYFPDEEV